MPIRRFKCPSCSLESRVFQSKPNTHQKYFCTCGTLMKRIISNVASPITKEILDHHRNKQLTKNTQAIMKARSKKHFVEHEMDDLIQKYGEKYSKAVGWLKPDGTKKKLDDYK